MFLNMIKEVIKKSIKVEVKNPITRNNKTVYPVLVTDVSESVTRGWHIQYNPSAWENNTRLFDGSETFSQLTISQFGNLYSFILTAHAYFLQGVGVERLSDNRQRAIYQATPQLRLTVTSQTNSVAVAVAITDEQSPFYMMSIPFTVTNNNNQPYVIGSDKYWDRNTDTFVTSEAYLSRSKARFYRVQQQQNGPATLRAKIAVVNGQYAINPDGTFQVDINAVKPEYIQTINNEYRALAYIYEQNIMDIAFQQAIAQGLPTATSPQQNVGFTQQPGFTLAFSVPNMGQPNLTQQQAMQPQHQQAAQPMQQAAFTPNQPVNHSQVPPQYTGSPIEVSEDQLPWQDTQTQPQ